MKKLIPLLASMIVCTATFAQWQTKINLKSITHNGVTDTVNNAPIVVDNASGKVTVSSNKKVTGSQYDATTAQQISNGIMTWTASFNLSTQKSWVAASTTDASGMIYVTGGVATGTTNGVDLFCACYNPGGGLNWSYTYNGPGSETDVGTAIVLDGAGDVYICGASDGTNTCLTDFVTIKLSGGTGSQVWVSRYNYNNSYDAALTMTYNTTSNYVVVSGPSGSTYTDWEQATVSYKASDGSQVSVNRVANTGTHQDKAFGLATDTLGNAYAVGTIWNSNNSSYDISIQKLDTALNMVWIKKFDGGYNLNDAGFSLSIDDSLNIYVVGTGYYQDTTLSNLILLKYDKNGNLKWSRKKRPFVTGSSAEGLRVKVKTRNEIFVGGNFTSNNNQDIALLRYDEFGSENIEKIHNGSQNGEDRFLDLALGDSGYVYVSGRVYASGSLDSNIVLTYQYKDFPRVTNSNSSFKYVGNELIIGFHPKTMIMSTINNREKTWGKLKDFVADSTCNKINAKFGASTYSQDFFARKIFDLTAADSLSDTRLGDQVHIPKFYATILVSIPETYSLFPARDSIKRIKNDIYYSCLNLIAQTAGANDSLFPQQYSLRSNTVYPNAHVNADSAWAITSGVPTVKVGIYDTGVDFSIPDFQGMNWGGFNFVSSVAIDPQNTDDYCNHGTPVAAIVGARRNNTIGIAGIAGGDADSGKVGVSIYDCRILDNSCSLWYTGALDNWMNALNVGCRGTNANGFGLHVTNNSYWLSAPAGDSMTYPPVQDQLIFANRNGVAFVGAKMNVDPGYPNVTYPADWNPEIVTCVGGSGNDGHYSKQSVNSGYNSMRGYNIDLVAPGSASVVYSAEKYGVIPAYNHQSGNSYAAPHVSGAMGLMMSYWNHPTNNWDNLVNNDCEEILKRTATDLTVAATYSETAGWDNSTGNGRINVYKALKALNKHYYRIRHIDQNHYKITYATTQTLSMSSAPVKWEGYNAVAYTPSYVPTPIIVGTYSTEIYKITTTITYSLNPSEKIVGYWPFYKSSWGWNNDTANMHSDRPYWVKIDTVNNTTAKLTTYMWKNLNNGNYYPSIYANLGSAITLYTYDSTGTVGIAEKSLQPNQNRFEVYPNPSTGDFKLSFHTEVYSLLNYQIFDILGREIKRDSFKTNFGSNVIDINFKGGYGMYILKVFDGNKQVYTQKLIKNE